MRPASSAEPKQIHLDDKGPFQRVSVPYGDTGSRRELCRYTCVKCGAFGDIVLNSPASMAIEVHRKTLTMRGWSLSSRSQNPICPQCLKPSRSLEVTQPSVAAVSAPATVSASAAITALGRGPTSDQRLAIRGALDKNFDDKAGMYLGGCSDISIAEDLNLPRAWVEMIREAAYGPIRITPEIQALQRDLAALQQTFNDALADMKRRLDRVLGESE